jgi:hypothetical protein
MIPEDLSSSHSQLHVFRPERSDAHLGPLRKCRPFVEVYCVSKISSKKLGDTCRYSVADPKTGRLQRMVFGELELDILRYQRHTLGSRTEPKGRDLILLDCQEGVFLVSQTWWNSQLYPFILEQQLSSNSESLFDNVTSDLTGYLKKSGLAKVKKPSKLEVYSRTSQGVPPSPFE